MSNVIKIENLSFTYDSEENDYALKNVSIDIKKGSYNVLKNKRKEEIVPYIKTQIAFCINEACKAFELLEIKKYKPIIGNILYLGLEETAEKEIKNERPVQSFRRW